MLYSKPGTLNRAVWSSLSCTAACSAGLDRADDKVPSFLTLEEREQFLVHFVLERGAHAVRRAFIDLESRVLDQLGREHCRRADGYDLVVVAMKNQSRDV